MRLNGKVAIISGEMSGVGESVVRLFVEQGAKVVITGSEELSNEFTSYINLHQDCTVHYPSSSLDPEHVQAMLQYTKDTFGTPNILVCTDSSFHLSCQKIDTLFIEDDAWRKIMDEDLTSQFLLCKYIIPEMKQLGGGSIVFTSSIAGLRAIPMAAAYSVAKSGIHGLMRCISGDHCMEGVRANAVCAGFYCADNDRFSNVHPVGQDCTPEDVAQAILFLASDESKFITGITLPVDGGLHTT